MIFLGSEMVQVKLMVVRRVFGSGLAILARFLDVAVLEEEALVVRPWIVIHVELGPEVAVVQDGALEQACLLLYSDVFVFVVKITYIG